jgi:site-specific recombinase XerD
MKRPWTGFQSPLGESIANFLEYNRALHKKYKTEEDDLRIFDRYLSMAGITSIEHITAPVMDAFFASYNLASPATYNQFLSVVSLLFKWMVRQNLIAVSPLQPKSRRKVELLKPFILSQDQVKQLLVLASQLPDTSTVFRRGVTYKTIILLGYGLGLRVGEISRLKVADVDFARGVLIIRDTKFSKTRLVPMGPKMVHQLKDFLAGSGEQNGSDPVFCFSRKKRPLRSSGISMVFHGLTLKMPLRPSAGEREPCFHSLRHSFAVNTLLRLYREGEDPAKHLIHLSTFLGHTSVSSTAVYLTITGNLLDEANKRFHKLASAVFKEAGL